MSKATDRYAEYGGTVTLVSDLMSAVHHAQKALNKRVWQEGSTGPERTLWINDDGKNMVVGHAWVAKNMWRVRIFERAMEP